MSREKTFKVAILWRGDAEARLVASLIALSYSSVPQ